MFALVTYGDPVVTGGKIPLTTSCTPVSGASFPIGTSSVACKTTDALQRTDSCAFNVVVTRPPQIRTTSFVAFGDSITFGEDGIVTLTSLANPQALRPHFQVSSPYPVLLAGQLKARYTAQTITIANRGEIGERASGPDTLARFAGTVLSGGYGAVLLMEGANDLDEEFPGQAAKAIANIGQMLSIAKGRSIRPYLATIPPQDVAGVNSHPPPVVRAFNDQVRALALANNVTLVDVFQVFPSINLIDGGLLGADGLHPTQAGYTLIANSFFNALKDTLEIPATP